MKVLRMRSWNFHADKLDEMTRFYQDALGAELRTQHTVGGVKVNRLRAGETGLGLFDASEKRVTQVPHHTFDIEGPTEPQELIKELEAKGIKVDDMDETIRKLQSWQKRVQRRPADTSFAELRVSDIDGKLMDLSVKGFLE